jgi:subtilisin family serine protease/subtilisin-like proprotein convertase family protein
MPPITIEPKIGRLLGQMPFAGHGGEIAGSSERFRKRVRSSFVFDRAVLFNSDRVRLVGHTEKMKLISNKSGGVVSVICGRELVLDRVFLGTTVATIEGVTFVRILVIILLCLVGTANSNAGVREFRFTEPQARTYQLLVPDITQANPAPRSLQVVAETGPRNLEFTDRVILQILPNTRLEDILGESPLEQSRVFATRTYILQAPDAVVAAEEAARLARHPEVTIGCPVRKFERQTGSRYAVVPNDPQFFSQWNLEDRNGNGTPARVSLNVREAWPISRGEGIVVGVGDDGVELAHPDLFPAALGQPHRNFEQGTTNGNHLSTAEVHGTAVAGLAIARGGNGVGMAGVAPQAGLAAWKMINVSSEGAADVYQFEPDKVWVQNYSWTSSSTGLGGAPLLERIARTNTFKLFRGGRGLVVVHSAGNERDREQVGAQKRGDANEDSYVNTAGVIAVAALRSNGQVASYSNPGACLLVAAPGGEIDRLFTTDRLGNLGLNRLDGCIDFTNCADYAFDAFGFIGTSAAAPQISGLAALVLGANTNLAVRDVQQIIALSARQPDPNDGHIQTNAAGLAFSHDVGFGLPDAGTAVRLAKLWSNRPPTIEVALTNQPATPLPIPDPGHLVGVSGISMLTNMTGLFHERALHPDAGVGSGLLPVADTLEVPLVDVGLAGTAIGMDLTGKAALIERGGFNFSTKLRNAADAGALFGIIYNHTAGGAETLVSMNYTDPVSIPGIFITRADGLVLQSDSQTNATLRVKLILDDVRLSFIVTNQLQLERVAVRVQVNHPRRHHLRIVLHSPSGTVSIMQHSLVCNASTTRVGSTEIGPSDWTYHSVAHLYEPAMGEWQLQFVDDEPGTSGSVLNTELYLTGVPIVDADGDGLDDAWEIQNFSNLAQNSAADPDLDGYQNSREQVMGTNPTDATSPHSLTVDSSIWNQQYTRLSWFGSTNHQYTLEQADNGNGPYVAITNVISQFPVTETFLQHSNVNHKFFRVRATAQ